MSMTQLDKLYPAEFLDISSMILPTSLKEMYDLSTSFFLKNGTYQQVAKRAIRHFITDVEFDQDSTEEKDELKLFLKNDFALNIKAGLVGDDFLAYGQSTSTIVMPFDRFLRCKVTSCRAQTRIENLSWDFNGSFRARCPYCGNYGTHELIDRPSKERERINLFRVSPYQTLLRKHPLTGYTEVRWDIDPEIRQKIQSGDKFTIQHMPFSVLDAVYHNAYLLLDPTQVHHYAEQSLAGVASGGYGMPRLLASFSNIYYTHMLRRANESIAHGHSVPLRLLSPGQGSPVGASAGKQSALSLMTNVNPSDINRHMQRIIEGHRKDPSAWHYAPFPMTYQSMSGDANMVTPQLLENGMRELMSSMGFPMELHYGTIAVEGAPMAIRLMEQCWGDVVHFLNSFARFSVKAITRYMDWTVPKNVEYKASTIAADLERKHILAQLAAGGAVSQDTFFGSLGLKRKEERMKIMDEMLDDMKSQEEFDKLSQARSLTNAAVATPGGSMVPATSLGGAPVQAGGATQMGAPIAGAGGQTPGDIMAQASDMASQLLQMPDAERKRELTNIRGNELLHAAVTNQLKKQRYDLGVQGRSMILQGG